MHQKRKMKMEYSAGLKNEMTWGLIYGIAFASYACLPSSLKCSLLSCMQHAGNNT